MRLVSQLRHHSVALISLVVALTSLAYNTWRNERTEANRNVRTAGIELLLRFGQLDQVVFFSHYDNDAERGNPHEGWAVVLVARDLAMLVPEPAATSTRALYAVWRDDFDGLGSDDRAAERISAAIEQARDDVRRVLVELD